MVYRISIDGIKQYEEVVFYPYTKENAIHARELIKEKYSGHELVFSDDIDYDMHVINTAELWYNAAKDIINALKMCSETKNFLHALPALCKYICLKENHDIRVESFEHSSLNCMFSEDKTNYTCNDNSGFECSNLRMVQEYMVSMVRFLKDGIYEYEHGYIVSSLGWLSEEYCTYFRYVYQAIEKLCKAQYENDSFEDDWTDGSNYGITEWR